VCDEIVTPMRSSTPKISTCTCSPILYDANNKSNCDSNKLKVSFCTAYVHQFELEWLIKWHVPTPGSAQREEIKTSLI
jgi:hypothetical protein